ncbi:geranylgeranylglycerol-phosphate geranylgeranyltransferase [Desulfurococcaceae archaeon MEX13E-LK6-19]|nr:geranylgeranylglycerol-phosphate geranylgeranyltransferase [Desulfurococcaceae archaeon MEX13E-LK6-19]
MGLGSKIKAIIMMTRPLNSFMTGLAVVFAFLVNNNYMFNTHTCLIGFLTGFLVSSASMLINDYVDLEADKINKPWKPLPQGLVSPVTVLTLSLVLLTIAILINLLISQIAFFTVLVLSIIAYSYSFMRRYWWSHFMVSIGTTAPFIYGYVLAGLPREYLLFNICFIVVIFLINSAREFTKSITDIAGDKKLGYSTIAIKYGEKNAAKAALIFSIIGTIIAVVLGVMGYASIIYTIMLGIAGLWFTANAFKVYINPNKEVAHKAKNNMIKAMLLALIGYLLSRIQ